MSNELLENLDEVEYVSECPFCGTSFIGMSPEEYREYHSADCPYYPLPLAAIFLTEEQMQELDQ